MPDPNDPNEYLRSLGINTGGGATPGTPTTRPQVQPGPAPTGFTPGSDPTTAYKSDFKGGGKNAIAGPAKVYWDDTAKTWRGPIPVTPDEYNTFARQGAAPPVPPVAATTQPQGAPTSPGTPAPAPLGTPAPTSLAGMSSYAQTLNSTTSGGITPDRYGPPLSYTVPGTLDQKTGQMNIVQPNGQTQQQFVPYQGTFQNYTPNAPAPAAPPPVAAPAPAVGAGPINPTGGVGNQAYGPPSPVPTQGNSNFSSQQQAFISQMLPYAQQWSAQTGLPPEYYLAMNASESNWGAAGTPFGIKGSGTAGSQDYNTFETVNGKNVPINDQFAKYNSPADAYKAFTDLTSAGRYAPAWQQFQQDKNPDTFLQGLNQAGYATNPGWASMIGDLAGQIRPSVGGTTTDRGWGLPAVAQGIRNSPDMWQNMITGANNYAAAAPASIGTGTPAATPGPTVTRFGLDGPQIAHLNSASQGYNPLTILRGNGITPTGSDAQDAVLAARILQNQVPGGGYGDPLANRAIGAAGTFQSPLSGGLQNEIRTSGGYAFSPGNVNEGNSLRSPMNSGAYTPVMTPQGVVISGANRIDQTPASQAQAYQQAGFGVPIQGQPPGSGTYPLAPTSNVGAVIQAAEAQAREPQATGQFFQGAANLAGANPNSNLELNMPVGYASAANLPSEQALIALGQAQQDKDQGLGGYGSGAYGADGGTRFLASGGEFYSVAGPEGANLAPPHTTHLGGITGGYGSSGARPPTDLPSLLQAFKAQAQSVPGPILPRAGSQDPWHPMGVAGYAGGGSFLTTQPTLFPMANGGTAVTSEYGQPEKITVTPLSKPMHMMAGGGSFTSPGPANPGPAGSTSDADPYGLRQGATPSSSGLADDGTPLATPEKPADQTNTGSTNYDYGPPSAQVTAAEGSGTPEARTDLTHTAPPPSTAPAPTPTISGSAFAGAIDSNPELVNQTELARQQGLRDQYGYLYRAAQVGTPIGISNRSDVGGNLAPSQYWQPVDYTNQIQGLQARLAALGPVAGDPAQLAQDLVAAQNGYGGNGPGTQGYANPDPVRAAQIQMQLQNMTGAADLMNQIQNLRANQPSVFKNQQGQDVTNPTQAAPAPIQDVMNKNPAMGQTLAALHSDASQNRWTPQHSDALVQLAQQLNSSNRDTVAPALTALTSRLATSRAVPPGLNSAAYQNPVAMAAAAKFA